MRAFLPGLCARFASIALTVATLALTAGTALAQDSSWKIKKAEWSQADEAAYQEFVVRIGEAVDQRRCTTVRDCLKSPANPYRASDPSNLRLYADCADFPYYLRAYFAWKNGLPFSMATGMSPRNVPGNSGDIRYSKHGNRVSSRADVTSSRGRHTDAVRLLNESVPNLISSAMFRVHAEEGDGQLFSDHYPTEISRRAILPGSIVYDPNGHVAVVWKVGADGRAHFIDAHPDNSLTSGVYGKQFVRSNPGHGAGFRSWRPIRLVDAGMDSEGNLVGGRIVALANNQLALYSTVQIFGTHRDPQSWKAGPFIINGQSVDYYDYVRQQLAEGRLVINPENEMRDLVRELCNATKDRVIAVDAAIKAGINRKGHPDRLPQNIYGTHGEWETYSTPSRDARLKVIYQELLERTKVIVAKQKAGDSSIEYSGNDLPGDLLAVYQREAKACEISYENSVGRPVYLNLDDVRRRLFALSFDPYHCVELRWGASSADELATCADGSNKLKWYRNEQYLRNQLERTYDAKMDYTADELLTIRPGVGVATPPDVDVVRYLMSLQ